MENFSFTASLRDGLATRGPLWSVAVFAHNEATTILGCLDAIRSQAAGQSLQIFVLINGSRDSTESLVKKYAASHANIVPVVLSLADKANAWNHYIHVIRPKAAVHFFVDGDMSILPNSFEALSRALRRAPECNAAGALPATGRSHAGWSLRMQTWGRLAGCLYALKGIFVEDLRLRQICIPTGLIGEDLFLSCVVKEELSWRGLTEPSSKLVFSSDAGFAFRPLSPARPQDWLTYGRRLVRYQIRDYQLALLMNYLQNHPHAGIPHDMPELYRQLNALPRYRWLGRMTLFDILAIKQLRHAIRRSKTSGAVAAE